MLLYSTVIQIRTHQIKGLSLERLAALVAVGEAGGMAEAAGGEAVRQSLMSRQIKELEAHFGCALLDRSTLPRRLTPTGEALAAAAGGFLRTLGTLGADETDQRAVVTIGGGETVLHHLVLPLVKSWPGLDRARLVLRNLPSHRLVRELEMRRMDLAVLRASAVPPTLVYRVVARYGYKLCLPARAKMRGPIKWKDLAKQPLAVLEGDGGLRRWLREASAKQGVTLDLAMEATSYPQVAEAIADLGYAGFLPSFVVPRLPAGRVRAVVLEDLSGYQVELAMARHPQAWDINPPARSLWAYFEKKAG